MSRAGLYFAMKVIAVIYAALIVCMVCHGQSCVTNAQVTLTGNLRTANGLPSSNYTLTLTPSQQGYIAGCGVNLAQTNTCGTSIDGSVVGIPNPQTPTVNTTSGGGSLPSGVYYSVYEWYDAAGHVTLASPETARTLSATGSLVVNPPASGIPSLAVGMDVFISTTSGTETLQGQSVGSASFVQSTALVTGASPASTNTTLCQITANDAVWPTGTGYNVSLVDSNADPVPNYPMQWQLIGPGTTINLSNGLPYYHGVVFYPVPILSAPQNHGAQSISGQLNHGGYNDVNIGKLGVGTATPGWGIDAEGSAGQGAINAAQGYLFNGNAPNNHILLGNGSYYVDSALPNAFFGPNPNTPTLSSSGLGTGASVTLQTGSSDFAGGIVISTGTGPSNPWTVQLTFGGTYTNTIFCEFMPQNSYTNNTVGISGFWGGTSGTTSMSVSGPAALPASTSSALILTYLCAQ